MAVIRILEDQVVNQIAAGEVVERPAAVVKELVENALDAGAARVLVRLAAGGRDLVRVEDDGCGMDADDALLCLERHGTSKIREAEDLYRVCSLGFRGEALPSIAAVSRFELLTRRPEDEVGTRVVVDGGQVRAVEPAGCPAGTRITVRDLFYNLPARRKFLRAERTELEHAREAVVRAALGRHAVDFALVHEGGSVLRAPSVADRRTRASALLGPDGAQLVHVGLERDGVSVTGLVSPAGVHRGSAVGASYLYVNGRFVRDLVLRRAVAEACQDVVPRGRHPVVVLDVAVAPDLVDVNIHPAKTEVRFRDGALVHDVVVEALRRGLGSRPAPPAWERPLDSPTELPLPGLAPSELFRQEPRRNPLADLPSGPAPATGPAPPAGPGARPDPAPTLRPPPPVAAEEPQAWVAGGGSPRGAPEPLACVGSVLVALHGGRLLLVDRATARASLVRAALAGDPDPVPLLTPALVDLAPRDVAVLERHRGVLHEAGLDVESYGGGTVAVREVPRCLGAAAWLHGLPGLAEVLREGRGHPGVVDRLATLAGELEVGAGRTGWKELLAELDAAGLLAPPVATWASGPALARLVSRGVEP